VPALTRSTRRASRKPSHGLTKPFANEDHRPLVAGVLAFAINDKSATSNSTN
jgi:hypothetical protein